MGDDFRVVGLLLRAGFKIFIFLIRLIKLCCVPQKEW